MSDTAIFVAGLLVTGLCALFVIFTIYEVRRVYAESSQSRRPAGTEEL